MKHARKCTWRVNKTIRLKLDESEGAWTSLGVYHLEAGACRVILNDRGGDVGKPENFNRAQNMIADAVKWREVED